MFFFSFFFVMDSKGRDTRSQIISRATKLRLVFTPIVTLLFYFANVVQDVARNNSGVNTRCDFEVVRCIVSYFYLFIYLSIYLFISFLYLLFSSIEE